MSRDTYLHAVSVGITRLGTGGNSGMTVEALYSQASFESFAYNAARFRIVGSISSRRQKRSDVEETLAIQMDKVRGTQTVVDHYP